MSFFDDLKRKAQGIIAQVNPLDGGKTYATYNPPKPTQAQTFNAPQTVKPVTFGNTQVQQPAFNAVTPPPVNISTGAFSQARNNYTQALNNQPKPVGPSYGSNPLTKFVNGTRDIFDANTPQDYARRAAQTAVPYSQNQTYVQQQQSRGVNSASIANNPAQRAVVAGKGAWNQMVAASPKTFGTGVGQGFGGDVKTANTAQQNLIDQTTKNMHDLAIQYQTADEATRQRILRAYQANYQNQLETTANLQGRVNQQIADTDPLKNAAAFADMGLTATTLGVGGATRAGVKGAATAAEALGKSGFRAGASELAAQTALTGGMGTTQGALGVVAQQGRDARWQDVAKGATIGGAMGAGIPLAGLGAGELASRLKTPMNQTGFVQIGRTPKNIHPDDQGTMSDFVDYARGNYKPKSKQEAYQLELDASRIAERYGILPKGNSDPVKNLASAFESRLNKDHQAKRGLFTKMNQVGAVGKDVRPEAQKPTVHPVVKEYAQYLKSIDDQARGGDMIGNYSDGYKRITTHSKFYSDFYAQNKKKPTIADWQAEAERQLKSGNGEKGYVQMYKDSQNPEITSLLQQADQGQLGKQAIGETIPLQNPPDPLIANKDNVTGSAKTNQELPTTPENIGQTKLPQEQQPQIQTDQPALVNSSDTIIPQESIQTPEQGIKNAKQTAQGKTVNGAKAKLLESVQKQGSTPEDIVQAIDPTRTVKANTEVWNAAGHKLNELGDDGALTYFHNNHGADANAVAWRLYEKRLSNGDKAGAQELLAEMTTRSIENGQATQAWAMIQRLDPKFIVQKLDREVQRVSENLSDRMKKRIDWNADKQAKIMQFAKGMADDKLIKKLVKANDTASISKFTGITDEKILKGLAGAKDTERVKMLLNSNLNKEINTILPSKAGDKALAYWKSGLLSAPVTHVRNIVGNVINAVSGVTETPIAGGFDATLGRLLTPTKRTVSANPLRGVGSGLKQGGVDFADALKYGITKEDTGKFNYKSINWNDKNVVEKYVLKPFSNAIFRTLGAEDKLFKQPAVISSLYNMADAAAITAGRRGDVAWMREWVKNAPNAVLEQAKAEGGIAVFQKDTVVSAGMRGLRNAIKREFPGFEKGVDAIQPFVNVPAAIGSELLTYTPAGLLRVTNKARKALNSNLDITTRDVYRRQAMKDLSKTTVGAGLIMAGMAMGYNGDATGNMPAKNTKEYDQWVLENRQPNSIKIGGHWFNINSIGPQGALFNAAAQTGAQFRRDAENGKQTSGVEKAIAFTGNVGTNYLNSSSLTGMNDASNALKNPTQYAQSYVARQATSFIPNAAKRFGSGLDPYQRDPQNFKEQIQSNIPFARNNVTPKTDVTGAPVPNNQYGVVKALTDPFNISKDNSQTAETKTQTDPIANAQQLAKDVKTAQAQALKTFGYAGKTKADVQILADAGDQNAQDALDNINAISARYSTKPIGPDNADKLSPDIQKFYNQQRGLTQQGKDEFSKAKPNETGAKLVSQVNAMRPKGLPEVPNTNETAALYADYKSRQQKEGWSKSQENTEKLKLLRAAYKSDLNKDEKYWYGASKTEIANAYDAGDITKSTMDKLVSIDNQLASIGGSTQIPNSLRRVLGYADAPKYTSTGATARASSGGRGRKAKIARVRTPRISVGKMSTPRIAKVGVKRGSKVKIRTKV